MRSAAEGGGVRSGYGDAGGAGDSADLENRFRQSLRAVSRPGRTPCVVAAVSGGLDSMTLLYLLTRIRGSEAVTVHAAHVDHRMHSGSGATAGWLREICADWDVPFHIRAASAPIRSEAEGRAVRYEFLEKIRRDVSSEALVATGHTADDQAETVLFRIARGSGPLGIRGILPEREPATIRPLLPFWRREIAAFAELHGIPFREDPTNQDLRWTRNRLRRQVIPALEDAVPGATAALASLADTARLHAEALAFLLDDRLRALRAASIRGAPGALALDHAALLALPDPVLALLLRRAVSRLGGRPGRAATRDLVRFVRKSPSGRRMTLAGGVTVERSLELVRIRASATADAAAPAAPADPARPAPAPPEVQIQGAEGAAGFKWGRCEVAAAWASAAPDGFPLVARFDPDQVRFPLALRPWRPGDRAATPRGRKKIKKLLLEARIPKDLRTGFPVLADADGAVVWAPGLAEPHRPAEPASRWIGVRISWPSQDFRPALGEAANDPADCAAPVSPTPSNRAIS